MLIILYWVVNSLYSCMSLKLLFLFMFYSKFDEVGWPVVSTVKTRFNRSSWAGWATEWGNCCYYFVSCIVKMTASIAKMSGFLEVAVTYTFQSPLCVRSSGSSAYRRGMCGHLSFIYVQRGRASKFWRSRGREARKNSFQLFFPLPPKLSPSSGQTLTKSDGRGSLIPLLCRNCDSGIPVCTEVPDRPTELAREPV